MSQTDEMIGEVEKGLLALGRGKPGDLVVFVAGTPPGTVGSTNMVRVHRLGE
jgi:pyruvate kinase